MRVDASWLPRPVGGPDPAEITATIKAFRAHLGSRLVEQGFESCRSFWVFPHPDLTWVVQLERVFTGPSVAVRVGIYVPAVATLPLAMNACAVHLADWQNLGVEAPQAAAYHRHSDRASYITTALRFDSAMDLAERMSVAEFAASELGHLAHRVPDLSSLALLLDDPPGGRQMLVTRQLRDLLASTVR